jgi:hypothetical protein
MFFFEKKNQKLLTVSRHTEFPREYRERGAIDKSFLLLFFKKEDLPSFYESNAASPITSSPRIIIPNAVLEARNSTYMRTSVPTLPVP